MNSDSIIVSDNFSFSDEMIQKKIDRLIKPLNNSTRQKILILLSNGPITYTEILEKLKLESGSFYWHIKKMEILTEQTEDRSYILSNVGQQAYTLLFVDHTRIVTEEYPLWFSAVLSYVRKITSASIWLLIQQIFLILLFTTVLFYNTGLYQYGTRIKSSNSSYLNILISILISLTSINFVEMIIIYLHTMIIRKDIEWRIPNKSLFRLFTLNYIFLTPVLVTGIISGLLVFIFPSIISVIIFQFILNLIAVMLAVLFSSALIVSEFDYSFNTAMIISLITFYPVVFLSFLL